MIAQTSTDRLDELNARAQALRLAHGELGPESLMLAGRPYRLHAGDEVQLRHTLNPAGTTDAHAYSSRHKGRLTTHRQPQQASGPYPVAQIAYASPAPSSNAESCSVTVNVTCQPPEGPEIG